jgi:hypothetical protein
LICQSLDHSDTRDMRDRLIRRAHRGLNDVRTSLAGWVWWDGKAVIVGRPVPLRAAVLENFTSELLRHLLAAISLVRVPAGTARRPGPRRTPRNVDLALDTEIPFQPTTLPSSPLTPVRPHWPLLLAGPELASVFNSVRISNNAGGREYPMGLILGRIGMMEGRQGWEGHGRRVR